METEGYTLFCVYDGYPRINTTGRMLEPLRYLTLGQEYKQLAESLQPKEAVDNFWLSLSGGADRAVEMIRNYYGRVEDANRFFFSFCEGWKTDRGMIYIIFGPPNVVYRSGQAEFWTYGEVNNYRSMEFVFIKVINPFTGNDYILQRQENYKPYWYNAVQQWRR
jgi:GWxTD domain-containing protein